MIITSHILYFNLDELDMMEAFKIKAIGLGFRIDEEEELDNSYQLILDKEGGDGIADAEALAKLFTETVLPGLDVAPEDYVLHADYDPSMKEYVYFTIIGEDKL